MIRDIQEEILRLKKENDVCILAHSYTAHEILEVADFSGDSYALSVRAKSAPQRTVLMVGVRFMAETVKILSPEKRVLLSHAQAGCPMAEQMTPDLIEKTRAQHPGCAVVAYINTTAALKTVCDVCVTSSSAVDIVRKLPQEEILFIPDCNLGAFVQSKIPEKRFHFLQGGCPIHTLVREDEVLEAKRRHPDALLLVHPECLPEVTRHADYVGSTAGIMQFAKKSDCKEFLIGTEMSIAEHLSYDCPDKRFYPLSKKLLCPDMKLSTLTDVYNAVAGRGGEEIFLDAETISKARGCIDAMIALGG
ncbi:MAG TPA: quinolinate synthase NadA [Candidatus Fimenecus excrementigallinarum]|uniref:Quinolinate synthase n=1 Tax=Candidatus Fimenecus excrementigallinarum TaxID=2840816 RepID=A0A9D1IHI5_9FIRM|nr:quinolinate synthase NadA [Candidatus Fimenecus excrementigallinarum]